MQFLVVNQSSNNLLSILTWEKLR